MSSSRPTQVVAITFGDQNTASTFFRLEQYRDLLAQRNISLTLIPKQKLSLRNLPALAKADVVINQKSLLSVSWLTLIRACARRLVFDWDDAFWTNPGKPRSAFTRWRVKRRLHTALRQADKVVSANSYLDQYAQAHTSKRTIIPMGIDLADKSMPIPFAPGSPVIGWVGAPSNLPYLEAIDGPLSEFLRHHPNARLKILCGQAPKLSAAFEHTPWTHPGCEIYFLKQIHIGLLPLNMQDEFSLGKSPIKALEYMAAGAPVVGNVSKGGSLDIAKAGGCISVEQPQQWLEALESLLEPTTYAQHRAAALQNVKNHHDIHTLVDELITAWGLSHA